MRSVTPFLLADDQPFLVSCAFDIWVSASCWPVSRYAVVFVFMRRYLRLHKSHFPFGQWGLSQTPIEEWATITVSRIMKASISCSGTISCLPREINPPLGYTADNDFDI